MMKKVIGLLALIFSYNNVCAMELCQTHIQCPINTTCECSTGASSAYARFFYGDFQLANNHQYKCTLESTGYGSYVLDRIDVPSNILIDGARKIPLNLTVNTTKRTTSAKLSIRFLVPASDIPNSVRMSCQIIEG